MDFRKISCLGLLPKFVEIFRLNYNRIKAKDTLQEDVRTFRIGHKQRALYMKVFVRLKSDKKYLHKDIIGL